MTLKNDGLKIGISFSKGLFSGAHVSFWMFWAYFATEKTKDPRMKTWK